MDDRITAVSGGGEGGQFAATMARIVLEDCKAALHELKAEPSGQAWRIKWVAVLALLRTVREVLFKVDIQDKPELKAEINRFRNSLGDTEPEPFIYWKFIRRDANNILHEYKFSAVQSATFHPLGVDKPATVSTSAVLVASVAFPKEDRIAKSTYRMKTGPFAGEDQRDVVQKAIDWWQEQIEDIEIRAAASTIKGRI